MHAPQPGLRRRAWTSRCGDRGAPAVKLGLDEQVRERWMCAVAGRRREHHLTVTRDLELTRSIPGIPHRDTANLGRILGRHGDFHPGLDIAIGPLECHSIRREHGPIPIGWCTNGLMRCRPKPAPAHILYIAELAAVVGGPVGSPPCDSEILEPTVARTGVTHHDRVRQSAKQGHARCGEIHFVHFFAPPAALPPGPGMHAFSVRASCAFCTTSRRGTRSCRSNSAAFTSRSL